MSNWRALADEALKAGNSRNTRDASNDSRAFVPTVPSVPPLDPARALREWRAGLASVSPNKPLHGLERGRWWLLVEDASWLLDRFGGQAARDAWSALDLFGIQPGRDGWGGIACRLRSSRSLVMSADLARWRRVVNGSIETYARGLGQTVEMVPLWSG